jgi:GNAT superfamily N-acetyltransferase
MTLGVIQDIRTFYALRDEWDTLLLESSANTIFLTWEWLYEWWNSYVQSGHLLILTLRDQSGRLQGIAPLYWTRIWKLGIVPVKVLRFIGDDSGDSEYLDFITRRGVEEQAVGRFLNYLQERVSLWDVCVLHGMPETSPTNRIIVRRGQENNYNVRCSTFPCSIVPLPKTWDLYLGGLDRQFRWKIRSRLRNLRQEHKVEVVECPNRSSLGACLSILYDLHGRRWANKYEAGCFSLQRQRFYQGMGGRFLDAGWLRFYFLKIDGEPVAAEFDFEYAGKVYSLQRGFDPACGQDSYGSVLQACVLQEMVSRGVREYDLLRGDSVYKTRWNTRSATCHSIEVGRLTIPGLIFTYGPVVAWRLRAWCRTNLPTWVIAFKRLAYERIRRSAFVLLQPGGCQSVRRLESRVQGTAAERGLVWVAKKALQIAGDSVRKVVYQKIQMGVWKRGVLDLESGETDSGGCVRVYDKAQADIVVPIMTQLEWYRDPAGVIARLDHGDVCVVSYLGDVPACFSWICTGQRYLPEARKTLTLDSGEFCIYDLFTFSAYRNRKFATCTLKACLQHMAPLGYHTAYIDTDVKNTVMRRLLFKLGFQPVERIIARKVFAFLQWRSSAIPTSTDC